VIEPDAIDRHDRRLGVGVRGQEHAPRIGIELDRFDEELRPRHLGHPLVDEKERDVAAALLELLRRLERVPTRADLHDAIVGAEVLAEIAVDGIEDLGVIVDGENHGLGHG
jgi:hypothetical protein